MIYDNEGPIDSECRMTRAERATQITMITLLVLTLAGVALTLLSMFGWFLYQAGILFYALSGIAAIGALWGGIYAYLCYIPNKHMTDKDNG